MLTSQICHRLKYHVACVGCFSVIFLLKLLDLYCITYEDMHADDFEDFGIFGVMVMLFGIF